MINQPAEPPYFYSVYCVQLRAALQEYHFAVYKTGIAGIVNIHQQCIACTQDMIGHTVLRNGNVFHPAGSAAGFGKVQGTARPQHISLALLYALHPGAHCLIIANSHCLFKVGIGINRIQAYRPAISGVFRPLN